MPSDSSVRNTPETRSACAQKKLQAAHVGAANGGNPAAAAGNRPAPPCTLVIFGGGGDLTKRLLMPALYNLVIDGLLDNGMRIVGVNRGERALDDWRDELHTSLKQFAEERSSQHKLDDDAWNWLAQRLDYVAGDFSDAGTFEKVKQQLGKTGVSDALFYLAVGEGFFKPIVEQLGNAGLLDEQQAHGFRRLVIEKPFGNDLASARELNAHILQLPDREQAAQTCSDSPRYTSLTS